MNVREEIKEARRYVLRAVVDAATSDLDADDPEGCMSVAQAIMDAVRGYIIARENAEESKR